MRSVLLLKEFISRERLVDLVIVDRLPVADRWPTFRPQPEVTITANRSIWPINQIRVLATSRFAEWISNLRYEYKKGQLRR